MAYSGMAAESRSERRGGWRSNNNYGQVRQRQDDPARPANDRRKSFSPVYQIPDSVKPGEMIHFEAQLSKHGLKSESFKIVVLPKIKISDLR
jgi:hypothetical protein